MRPECAREGTVTASPACVVRIRTVGERRLMRAPGELGNAIAIPALSPTPRSSSLPWTDTWWGLPLQRSVGVQLTAVMRTLLTCRLAGGAAPVFVELGALVG